jgi:3-hydroxyisobutyrate dehydrogenase
LQTPLHKAGLIGAGLMGQPIGLRLLESGHGLIVADINPARLEKLKDLGAQIAKSPADVCRGADFILTCVDNVNSLAKVLFDPGGIEEAGAPSKTLIDLSSVPPRKTRDLAAALQEKCGMRWIDCPMSGGVPAAREGSLVLFCGGDKALHDAAAPILDSISQRRTLLGPLGAGQAAKQINQIIVAAQLAAIAEGIKLGEAFGLDVSRLPEAFQGANADSRPLRLFAPRMAARSFDPPIGKVANLLKDMDDALGSAEDMGVRLPMAGRVAELLRAYGAAGHFADCSTSLITSYDPEDSGS